MRQVEDLAMCETHCACQLAELVRTVCLSRLDETHLAECAAVGHTEWRARKLRDTCMRQVEDLHFLLITPRGIGETLCQFGE